MLGGIAVMLVFNEFAHRDDAAAALARALGARVRAAVLQRSTASLIVSDDAAPRPLFRALRTVPLPWCSITIVPSDERWAVLGEGEAPQHFWGDVATGEPGFAKFVTLCALGRHAGDPLPSVRKALATVSRPFDAVVLGMGADGHTASLYPDCPDIGHALHSDEPCVMQAVPSLDHPRITLTLRALLDSQAVDLLFFGVTKRAVFEQALAPGPVEKIPIRAFVRQQAVPVSVYWAP
jgi:6-phosphogluconolactonase